MHTDAPLDCNATCQKTAWKKGHKQECQDLKEDRTTSHLTVGMEQPPPRTAVIDDDEKEKKLSPSHPSAAREPN